MKTNESINPGDILLFSRPHRPFDYVIKAFTRSPYYHVALYAGDGKVLEARPQGVICDSIGGRDGGYIVIPAPSNLGQKALEWGMTQIGARFDKFDFVVIFLEQIFVNLHLNYVPRGKYTCTELVADAYKHAGIDLFPSRDTNDIEPKEFATLHLVHED